MPPPRPLKTRAKTEIPAPNLGLVQGVWRPRASLPQRPRPPASHGLGEAIGVRLRRRAKSRTRGSGSQASGEGSAPSFCPAERWLIDPNRHTHRAPRLNSSGENPGVLAPLPVLGSDPRHLNPQSAPIPPPPRLPCLCAIRARIQFERRPPPGTALRGSNLPGSEPDVAK